MADTLRDPQPAPAVPVDQSQADFHKDLVDFSQVQGMIETVTAIPTHTPTKFEQQVKLYVDSISAPTVKKLYVYSNQTHTWVALTEPASTITADSLAMGSIFDNYIDLIHWNSVDGFTPTTGGGGGTATPGDGALSVQTTNTTNSEVYICSTDTYYKIYETAKRVIWEFQVLNFNFVANSLAPIHFTASQAGPPSTTAHHFGWYINGGTLYAVNADGTTEKSTDTGVTIATGTQRTRLKIIATKGTDIKFYVNDVLKVTHTLNLPTTTDLYLNLGLKTTGNVNADMWLSRMLIQKEY